MIQKNKFMLVGISTLMFLMIVSLVMAKCYVNDQEIPCDIFWAQYGWFLAVPFTLIGLLFSIKPDWILKFQVWSMKILGSKWEPGKVIPKIYRGMGIIFLILGIISLYLIIFH